MPDIKMTFLVNPKLLVNPILISRQDEGFILIGSHEFDDAIALP